MKTPRTSPALILTGLVLLGWSTLFGQNATARFSVVDLSGRPVAELKPTDIAIKRGKTKIVPLRLEPIGDRPRTVMIMIDASASQERMLPDSKRSAIAFVGRVLRPNDKAAVAKLTGTVTPVQDFTGDLEAVKRAIQSIEFEAPKTVIGVPFGGPPNTPDIRTSTSLFESVAVTAKSLGEKTGTSAKPMILVVSDGVDTMSKVKPKQAIDGVIDAGVMVFAIGIGDEFYDGVDKNSLKRLTQGTGGMSVIPDGKLSNLDELVVRIGEVARAGYLATLPAGTYSGDLSVEVVNPALKNSVKVLAP